MDYNYIKVKNYSFRTEWEDEEHIKYVLSFNKRQHVKVSEKAKNLIDCFTGNRTFAEVIDFANEINISITENELIKFVQDILIANALIEGQEYDKKSKGKSLMWCHLPIIESDKLSGLFHVLKFFYKRAIFIISIILILFCIFYSIYSIMKMENIVSSVNSLSLILLTYLSLLLHEFGHIAAAYKMNISVGYLGIGMYLFNPVFYVDMTNAWSLNNKQRALVDIGGIYFQSLILIPITIIAIITDNSFCYMINVSILLLTLTNLVPFIKLDGYWLLCDYLELNNVSSNAYKILKDYVLSKISKKSNPNISHYGKKRKVYIIFSFIYILSTILILFLGLWFAVKAILSIDKILLHIENIIEYFTSFRITELLTELNSILIFILPIIFLTSIIVKVIFGFFKGLISGFNKMEVHNDRIN